MIALFCAICSSLLFSTPNAFALALGDKVQANGTVNVRQTAAGTSLGTQSSGTQGIIIAGPQTASLSGTSYTWWDVTFSTSPSGWVADIGLSAIVPAAPILISPGSSTSPGTTLSSLSPTLSWNSVSGANGYGAYVFDITSGTLVYNNDTVGNATSVSVGPLSTGHTFRWNARSTDSAGFSAYSSLLYFQTQTAAPTISSVSPATITGANSAQTLTIYGSGFGSGAQVNLVCAAFSVNATITASVINSGELQVSATFGNDPSSWTAKVINTGGASSSTYGFTVQAPPPIIQSLSPSSATAGGGSFILTVSGTTFDQGSVILWNGTSLPTAHTLTSGGLTTALSATIPAADIVSAGTTPITVFSPSPGGGTSTAATFTISGAPSSYVFGFDASAYGQPDAINWMSVASSHVTYNSQSYPISFVILRSSKGNADVDDCRFKDPDFTSRAAAASGKGLSVGAYHVAGVMNKSTGDTYSAASEADFFVQVAGNWIKKGNIRPFLDVEDHSCATLSTYSGLSTWVDQWMQEVIKLTGVTPIIYCDRSFATLLQSLSPKYDLWIADPGLDPGANPGVSPWTLNLIQYSWSGTVSGVDTAVDMDVFQGSLSQFQSALVIGSVAPPSTISVTLSSVPPGLNLLVDGSSYPAPQMVTWQSGSSHTISSATGQLSADSHTRYDFLSWSDGGNQTHSVAPTLSTIYTANFDTNYLLKVTASPLATGTIAENSAGPWYAPGASVILTATPQSGYKFVSWTGEDSYLNNVASVAMNGYRSVTASFAPLPPPPTVGGVSLSQGNIQLNVANISSGTTLVLESSTDLKTWTPFQTNSATGTTMVLSAPVNTTVGAQFLRLGAH